MASLVCWSLGALLTEAKHYQLAGLHLWCQCRIVHGHGAEGSHTFSWWSRYKNAQLPCLASTTFRGITPARTLTGRRQVIMHDTSLWGPGEFALQGGNGARWWKITSSRPRPANTQLGYLFLGWCLLHTATILLVWMQPHSALTLGAMAPVCTGYSSSDQECVRENWLSHKRVKLLVTNPNKRKGSELTF